MSYQNTISPLETRAKLDSVFSTGTEASKELRVSVQSICTWRRDGMPFRRMQEIDGLIRKKRLKKFMSTNPSIPPLVKMVYVQMTECTDKLIEEANEELIEVYIKNNNNVALVYAYIQKLAIGEHSKKNKVDVLAIAIEIKNVLKLIPKSDYYYDPEFLYSAKNAISYAKYEASKNENDPKKKKLTIDEAIKISEELLSIVAKNKCLIKKKLITMNLLEMEGDIGNHQVVAKRFEALVAVYGRKVAIKEVLANEKLSKVAEILNLGENV